MQPQHDAAIIANMQKERMARINGAILIGGFLVMMIAGIQGYKKLFGYSALGFLVSFIVIYNVSTRSPKCSLCSARLHQINQRMSAIELKRICQSEHAPTHLLLAAHVLDDQRVNQSSQGYECHHCRKMAILG